MNKKNGFTLVELMVVIVIIGVLAAVAIPKMMAATNKAKAGEGPQILRAIANLQAAYKAEKDTYLVCTETNITSSTDATGTSWGEIGFDQTPFSRYFKFAVAVAGSPAESFTATATLGVGLGKAESGGVLNIDQADSRSISGTSSAELQKLVPNWK